MINAPLMTCPSCGGPGTTTHFPADDDGDARWNFQCSSAACRWEWIEVDHPITPLSVIEFKMREIPALRSLVTLQGELDPCTPMHAREIWRLAALKVGASEVEAMLALLMSPSAYLWSLYIGAEEVYFVGEARTMEEATAMLKGMLL